MFNSDVTEKILTHKETRIIPLGYQLAMISIIEDVLEQIKGGKPDASISELFYTTNSGIQSAVSTTIPGQTGSITKSVSTSS